MSVRRVVDLDFDEIAKWYEARGHQMPHRSLFPPTGFIIRGIAAGFLYFTDSSIGIIDAYISNPASDKKARSDALNAITTALILFARHHKCKVVKCDTKLEAIKSRAQMYGFKPMGAYESLSLEL